MIEIYKDIKGYEGLYQISNFGNVKSIERMVKNSSHSYMKLKERILKFKKSKAGYIQASINMNNVAKYFYVHRLVAIAFLENPENKRTVNHKDGNKLNNSLENLEWATHKENSQHAFNAGLYDNAILGAKIRGKRLLLEKNKNSKIVLNTETGIYYLCMREAAESTTYAVSTLQQKLTGRVINNTNLLLV